MHFSDLSSCIDSAHHLISEQMMFAGFNFTTLLTIDDIFPMPVSPIPMRRQL